MEAVLAADRDIRGRQHDGGTETYGQDCAVFGTNAAGAPVHHRIPYTGLRSTGEQHEPVDVPGQLRVQLLTGSEKIMKSMTCIVIVLLLAGICTISGATQVPADTIQTLIIPDSGKYSLPLLQVNSSMEPVILNQELSTVDQVGVYRIPTGSIILLSDDGVNRVFDANGTQFLAAYDTGAHHTHSVPDGAFIDSEGNITYVLSGNLLVLTIIDATERGIAMPTPQPWVITPKIENIILSITEQQLRQTLRYRLYFFRI